MSRGAHVVYGVDDRPPLAEAVPLGIQHVTAMLLSKLNLLFPPDEPAAGGGHD